MIKYTFFLLTYACTINCFAQIQPQSGWLKVSIDNVKCINKSFDGNIEFDGHGNEISATYCYRIFKPSNPASIRRGADGTVIYGSNVSGMTRAGTQTPDLGGITNGDVVNIYKTVINEHIDANDIVLIAPNVWEWDNPDKTRINAFNAQLNADLDWAITQPYPFVNDQVNYAHNFLLNPLSNWSFLLYNKYKNYGPAFKYESVFPPASINGLGNRIIGLSTGSWMGEGRIVFSPTVVALDTRILGALAINNVNANRTGTNHSTKESQTKMVDGVTVTFTEQTFAKDINNGIYSILLRIEFIPDRPNATTNTALTSEPTKIIRKDATAGVKINTGNLSLALAGTWAGTKTNDAGLYPENFGFELTANNEFLIKNATGVVAAKGTYNFSNNILTGSYKLFSSSETFAFYATFDPATQKLTGTLGMGSSVNGQGKWMVTRR